MMLLQVTSGQMAALGLPIAAMNLDAHKLLDTYGKTWWVQRCQSRTVHHAAELSTQCPENRATTSLAAADSTTGASDPHWYCRQQAPGHSHCVWHTIYSLLECGCAPPTHSLRRHFWQVDRGDPLPMGEPHC